MGGIKKENTPVIMWPCHKGPNQKFKYNKSTKQIMSLHSKKCVDIGKNGAFVQKKCQSNKLSQKWKYQNKKWRSLAKTIKRRGKPTK